MSDLLASFGRFAKFLTALAGACAQLLSSGLVTGNARTMLTVAISTLTAIAVFLVPNQTTATSPNADA